MGLRQGGSKESSIGAEERQLTVLPLAFFILCFQDSRDGPWDTEADGKGQEISFSPLQPKPKALPSHMYWYCL